MVDDNDNGNNENNNANNNVMEADILCFIVFCRYKKEVSISTIGIRYPYDK